MYDLIILICRSMKTRCTSKSEFEIYTCIVIINYHVKNVFVAHEILWLHSTYENTHSCIEIVNQ